MSLNPMYVTAPSLQSYFVDKDTGFPLAGGKVYFFKDEARTVYKDVFELQGNQANYTYVALPNPITLSNVGTIQDNNENDIIEYYFPFDENGDQELYYITVYSSLGVFQFDRQAWPNPNGGGINPVGSDELINYIPNGQLLAHNDLFSGGLSAGSNIIAQGGFTIELDPSATSTNTLTFAEEQFTDNPPQSPRYIATFTASTFSALEVIKSFRIKFNDVNKFSTKPGTYTFGFWSTATTTVPITINVYKYFGTSGSAATTTISSALSLTTALVFQQFTIDFGTNAGKTIDLTANNDYVAIDIAFPVNQVFTVELTDFVLTPGDVTLMNFPVQTNADMMARGVFGWTDIPIPNGSNLGQSPYLTLAGMSWGVTSGYLSSSFPTSGTFTTAANSSVNTIYRARLVGGGGGGGGANGNGAAAGGGGAGGYVEGTFSGVAAGTAITITIGTFGAGGSAAGGNGGDGGDTTIGTPVSVSAYGGAGGDGSTAATTSGGAAGGIGGEISTLLANGFGIFGQPGSNGFGVSANVTIGGNGGSTPVGFGGVGGAPNGSIGTSGSSARGYGGGGGGSIFTSTSGGDGNTGLVIIERMTQ